MKKTGNERDHDLFPEYGPLCRTLMERFFIIAGQMAYVEDAGGTAEFLGSLHALFRYISRPAASVPLLPEIRMLENTLHLYRCSINTLDYRIVTTPVPDMYDISRGELYFWAMNLIDDFIDSGVREPGVLLSFSAERTDRSVMSMKASLKLEDRSCIGNPPQPVAYERSL